jgi:hypothetical protein
LDYAPQDNLDEATTTAQTSLPKKICYIELSKPFGSTDPLPSLKKK